MYLIISIISIIQFSCLQCS